MENRTKIEISEIWKLVARDREINSLSLNEIDFVDESGNVVKIADEIRKEFMYTGLANTYFITTGFYKTGFEKDIN